MTADSQTQGPQPKEDASAPVDSYPQGVELTTAMLCKDGQYRSDCVVVTIDGTRGRAMGDEQRCGQPIAGIIHAGEFMGDIRMCQEHLDGAAQWMVPPGTPPDEYATAYMERMRARAERHRGQ